MKELVHSMTLIFSRKKMSEELKRKVIEIDNFSTNQFGRNFSPVYYMITQKIIHVDACDLFK